MATCMVIKLCEVCSTYTTPQWICSNNSTLMRRMNKACYFQSWDSIGGTVTSLWPAHQETTIQHLARTRDFSFSKTFRPALRPIQPPIQVAPEVFCKQYDSHSMGLTTHLHLAQRLRMYEAVTLHPRYAFKTHKDNFIFLSFLQYTLLRQFQPSLSSLL